jgi:NADPH-dependent curcumin reductase CurA
MFFIVTGQGLNGPVAITCDTAAAAVERAHALIADGVLDVVITDADGLQHPPDDFHRLLPGTDA